MGMNFDPMTGEPITDETVKEVAETTEEVVETTEEVAETTEEVVETTQEVTENVTDTVVPTVEQPTVYSSVPEDVVAPTPFYKSKAFIGGVACVAAVVVVGGVAMAALVTAVWVGMVAVSNVIEKRPVIGAGKEIQ